MPAPRRPASRPGLHLTARDRWIAAAVHEHRVLTTPQLTALAFDGPRNAQRRLSALTSMRVLDRFRPAVLTGSAPSHYMLGPVGAALLSTDDQPLRRLGPPAPLTLPHTLGVNDLYVALATAAHRDPGVRLERWWGERTCTHWWGRHARPDAYGRWHGPDATGRCRRVDFFVEFDTGSENHSRVVGKLDGYRRLAAATGITTPIVFVLPNVEREANLHARLTGWSLQRTPVATTNPAAIDGAPHPGGPIWLLVGAMRRAPLGELAGSEQAQVDAGELEVRGWTPPPPLPPTPPAGSR